MLKPVGAMWQREGKNGKFLAGEIDLGAIGKAKVLLFPNKKEAENHPDYKIYLVVQPLAKEEEPEQPF